MISIVEYSPNKNNEWNDFVRKSKNGIFMFNRDFMDYHSDRFKDNSLMFYENDELIALLPMSLHKSELRSHGGLTYGGFITNEKMKQYKMLECFEVLKQYMQEKNISKLLYKTIPHIYHKHASEEDLYALFRSSAKLLKIEPSTTIYLKNPCKMPKGRKAQISRAKREGVVIQESKDFKTFIDLENKILTEYHDTKAVHTAEELELLHSKFPEQIKLYIASLNNEMIAGTLIFEYENVVHTQYMASNKISREIGGLDLLIKTLIDKYQNTKMYFDFGISSENNGQILNEGLISQKEGFGARTVGYVTWEIGAN